MQTWLKSRRHATSGTNASELWLSYQSTHWVHSEDEGRSRIVGEVSHFIDLLQSLTNSTCNQSSCRTHFRRQSKYCQQRQCGDYA